MPQSIYCQFTDLKNGIWKFTFSEASERAVDEWFQWQSFLKESITATSEAQAMMLLDMRKSGPLPLLYTLKQGREWRKKYNDITSYQVKIAVLFLKLFPRYQQPYVKLIKDGVNLFSMEQVKVELFFNDEPKAIYWLLRS